jgi:hypothetical protein
MLPDKYWRVMDYIDHRGQNVVHKELGRIPKNAKAAINTFIQNIEVTAPPFDVRLVKKLKNKNGQDCAGLIEFRITYGGVQYRPIAAYGPGERSITIFTIATEQNSRFHPFGVCDTCKGCRGKLSRNEGKVVIHDFS